MTSNDALENPAGPAHQLRWLLSRGVLIAAVLLIACTFLLISPTSGLTYPGAIPWAQHSLLRVVVDAMSLGGLLETARGVEIKNLAFFGFAAIGLLGLCLRSMVSAGWPQIRERRHGAWFLAQVCLAVWVGLSLVSAGWSGDPAISLGQAALYALAFGWAISLAWTLQGRSVPTLIGAYVLIAACGAALCIWYYYERNPFHRPGFPIGNPGPLAACILPAIIVCVSVLTGRLVRRRTHDTHPAYFLVAALVLLAPLLWCFWLTGSRGGLIALVIGLGTIGFLRAPPRLRWAILVAALALAAAGVIYAYASRLDPTMARGATVRFRFYAWRYAAELWERRPITGVGAGSYPRMASQFAIHDRALDPAAFMGDMVEHAHNELFEILAEIGLVGGVSVVAGHLATLVAALALLRANLSEQRRALLIGLIAALVALLTDSLFGVAHRLPGLPAVHFTLLGALWAACRFAERPPGADAPALTHQLAGRRLRRGVIAALAGAAALLAGALTLRYSTAIRDEFAALAAMRSGDFASAYALATRAEAGLLDPVRVLEANRLAARALFEQARLAFDEWRNAWQTAAGSGASPATVPAAPPERVVALCTRAHQAATDLQRRAATLGRMLVYAARTAEMCAVLAGVTSPSDAEQWRLRAWQCWRLAHEQRPYDFDTLLALTNYPGTLGDHIGLLRNALRSGIPPEAWRARLAMLSQHPDFERMLSGFQQSVAPISADSDMNTISALMAPEIHRLVAAHAAQRGEYRTAADSADRAVQLYAALRPRFPTLYAVALAEQADYELSAAPDSGARAVELMERAIASLPRIQEQQYAEMLEPFQRLLLYYLLAAEREPQARALLSQLGEPIPRHAAILADQYTELVQRLARRWPAAPQLRRWIDPALRLQPAHARAWAWRAWLEAALRRFDGLPEILRQAGSAGVADSDLERIRAGLCQEFPECCAALGSPP